MVSKHPQIGTCAIVVLCLWASSLAVPAGAFLNIDFEHAYHVHPTIQVWDLCLVHDDGLYNIFYHGIPESHPHASYAHHIWRSTSEDMIHWSEPEVVLSISDHPHESLAIWAPAVVYNDDDAYWWMAYTGVDSSYNQRICMAYSLDLNTWHKLALNPVLEPDPSVYFYPAASGGAECRDPFLYRGDDGHWNMLVSAKLLGMSGGQGVIARATSLDMVSWSPLEVFLANEGSNPRNTLESVQYHVVGGVHHVFFHEHYVNGLSHMATQDLDRWNYHNRTFIDLGIAPEVVSFDDGDNWLLTRITPYQEPGNSALCWVARTDTLLFPDEGVVAPPTIHRPHPLARHFAVFSGTSCLGNPCFGDNPARRGETPAGPVGNFYFGSKEYYQGPLSGRGNPGTQVGLAAQGYMVTHPFTIQGNSIAMLIGGTNNPMHCFVALYDAVTDTVLRRATGQGMETMSPVSWDVRDLKGQAVYLRIEDSDPAGYINVDEINESMDIVTSVTGRPPVPAAFLVDLGPRPNPFNPSTRLQFELTDAAICRVRIHDLRGRLVWDSLDFTGRQGLNTVTWPGIGNSGQPVSGGVFVYRIEARGMVMAAGKLTLVP